MQKKEGMLLGASWVGICKEQGEKLIMGQFKLGYMFSF